MAEAASTDVERELDAIADDLYALTPDEFTAARDERVKKARGEGQAALAREIAKLRKPTQSAWIINLLWRDQREVLEQFFQVADALREAQAEAAGAELRELTNQRRQLENAMIRQAKALAEKSGVEVSASTEREAQETLAAALAQPEVADEVRTGRLVKPTSYAGFGALPPTSRAAAPRPQAPPEKAPAKIDDFATKAAERARQRREQAERLLAQARADLEAATDAFAEHDRAATAARKRHQDLVEELEQTESRLRDLKAQVVAAEQATLAAQRRREHADNDRQQAVRAVEHAEKSLRDIA